MGAAEGAAGRGGEQPQNGTPVLLNEGGRDEEGRAGRRRTAASVERFDSDHGSGSFDPQYRGLFNGWSASFEFGSGSWIIPPDWCMSA